MHRALFGERHDARLIDYYRDVKARLLPDGESRFGFRFSDEDQYVYLTTHTYRHYSGGGTGLRSLLDVYVYCRRKENSLDWAYIGGELDKLGLSAFEARCRALAERLFGGELLSEADEAMMDYVLASGVYGSQKHWVSNELARKGRVRYLLSHAFLPLATLRSLYPVLDRWPVLLPLCEFHHWISALRVKPHVVWFQLKGAFIRNTNATNGRPE